MTDEGRPLAAQRQRPPARWLTIHALDEGFAAFMRGVRDGVDPPTDGRIIRLCGR